MSALNISGFIWGIADDVLRDVYVRGKYRDVILPITVIRRLDAVFEPTEDAVLRMKAQLDDAGITNQDRALRQADLTASASKRGVGRGGGSWNGAYILDTGLGLC